MDKYLKNTTTSEGADVTLKRKRETSIAWNYFKKSKDNLSAVCNTCGKPYKTSGNTTNLMDHLKRVHPEYLKEDANIQPPTILDKFVTKDLTYINNSPRKIELDSSIMRMIAIDVQPFSIVDDKGFRELINKLDPRYKLPSKTHLRNVVLDAEYSELKSKIKNVLSTIQSVAITTDCWTSQANEEYLTVTCHFATESFKLKSAVLSTQRLINPTNHCAANIAESLKAVFEEWNVCDKVVTTVTDNDVTMKKACELLKIKNLPCVAHTKELLIQDILKSPIIIPSISKCKQIVTFFKSSTIATEKLKKAQGVDQPYGLIQEVPTRWNSSYFMLRRIIQINEEVSATLLCCAKAPNPINADEIEIIKELVAILEPFYEATLQVSANITPTISLVIPLLCELNQKICHLKLKTKSEVALSVIDIIQNRLPTRFSHYETRTVTRIATALDPRFKKNGFFHTSNAEQAKAKALEQEIASVLSKNTALPPAPPTPPATPLESEPKIVFTFLQNKLSQKVHTSRADAIIVLRQYFEKQNEPEDRDPLLYWMINSDGLQPLKALAAKYFCIPATSTESERTFSKAGQIISARRRSLKPNVVDKLLFLNKNYEF